MGTLAAVEQLLYSCCVGWCSLDQLYVEPIDAGGAHQRHSQARLLLLVLVLLLCVIGAADMGVADNIISRPAAAAQADLSLDCCTRGLVLWRRCLQGGGNPGQAGCLQQVWAQSAVRLAAPCLATHIARMLCV